MNEKHQFLFRLVSAIDEELLEKATRERARLHEAKPSKKTPWRRITLIASAAAVPKYKSRILLFLQFADTFS